MKIKLIKNDAEYEQFLARISELMALFSLSQDDEDELEVLVKLVEIYEDEKFPIDLPSPIDAIRFRMEQQGLKQVDLVPYIGSKSKVSEVLAGKRSLSLSMIRRLNEGLGIPADVLLQKNCIESTSGDDFDWLKFPINEMLKRGWLEGFAGNLGKAKKYAEKLMITFVEGAGQNLKQPVLCRQSSRSEPGCDPYALTAWKIRVCSLAKAEALVPYQKGCVTLEFARELVKLSYLDDGPLLAQEFLQKNGIHLVFEKHLPKTYLDGAVIKMNGQEPVIGLTLRYDRVDNFWFTLLHELAHLSLHLDNNSGEAFFDNLEIAADNSIEREADQWAQEALISSKEWHIAGLDGNSTPQEVMNFAKEMRIHPAIPAGRIRREGNNYKIFSRLVGNGRVRILFGMH